MVSARYHLVTVMSVFLALGLGILLGGSLGQQWLSEKQQGLIDQLERHYDEQVTQNRELSASLNKVQKAYRKEKDKTDELLRLT
ncbi:MAG: copper transporter, partial [Novibacillus thermophilus]